MRIELLTKWSKMGWVKIRWSKPYSNPTWVIFQINAPGCTQSCTPGCTPGCAPSLCFRLMLWVIRIILLQHEQYSNYFDIVTQLINHVYNNVLKARVACVTIRIWTVAPVRLCKSFESMFCGSSFSPLLSYWWNYFRKE